MVDEQREPTTALARLRALTARPADDWSPDDEIALVALRGDAAAELLAAAPAAGTGQPVDPGTVAPVDGPVDIADLELDPADLTVATLRAGFARHGAVILRGALSSDQVAALVECCDQALAHYDRSRAGEAADPAWFTPYNPPSLLAPGRSRRFNRDQGAVWAADSPRGLRILLDTLAAVGVTGVVGDHLGEPPMISVDKATFRRVPGAHGNGDWHQDGAFLGGDILSVNCWVALSHCGEDAPTLDIVPRRLPLVATGTDGAHFDWAVAPAVADDAAAPATVLRPTFAPGDLVLFDHLFLHRTGGSPEMTRDRYATETWFFAPSRYPERQAPLAV